MKSFIIIELFCLLVFFFEKSGSQNQTTTMIYNLLIYFLIENFAQNELRCLISQQFVESFKSPTKKLPHFPLLESLNIHLASLDTKNFQWNICDFELMETLASNEKIPIKSALIFLDLQAKIFLNNQIFARLASKPFLIIFSNNRSIQQIQDFILKFSKTCLNVFISLHKKPSLKEKKQKIINSKKAISEFSDLELKTLKSNRKAMIIELLRQILIICEEGFKGKITFIICQSIYQMKKYISKKPNKNLMVLLGEDSENIFKNYETDYYERISKLREEDITQKEEGLQMSLDMDNISRISGTSSRDLNMVSLELSNGLKSNNKSLSRRMSSPSPVHLFGGEKSKLTKADELKMNLLKNPNIDPKLRRKLLALQEKRKEHLKSLDITVKEQENKLQTRKVKLRKQVERKNKEQGVLAKNIKDYETILLFPLDSIQKTKEMIGKSNNLEIIDQELLEDYQIKMIRETFEDLESQRILKKVFDIYANIRERSKKPATFEMISMFNSTLSVVETCTLFKDLQNHTFEEKNKFLNITPDLISKTMKILVPKSSLFEEPVLDYENFKKFLISVAKFIYTENEIAVGLQKLIQILSLLISISRNNSKEKPSKTTGFNNKLIELNNKIQEDPSFLLPEGFRTEKIIKTSLHKEFPETLLKSINPSYLIAYEILDNIVASKFGIDLIEKNSKEKSQIIVKQAKLRGDLPNKSFATTNLNKEEKVKEKTKEELEKEEKLKKEKIKRELMAKAFEEKKQKHQEEKRVKSEKNLETQKSEMKTKRENDKKKLEQLQKNRISFEKQMKLFWEKKHQENLDDKKLIQKGKKHSFSPEQKMEREKMKKGFEEFNKMKIEKFREEFQKLVQDRKKMEEESVTKSHVFSKKLKYFNEKVLPKKIEEVREAGYEIKENQELIRQNFKSEHIQQFFKAYDPTLKALFSFLINQTYTPLTSNLQRTTIPLKTLLNFTNEFNVCPMLLQIKNIINFFKQITKNKPYKVDTVEVGLDYEEFKECLYRIAVKGNEVLNKICEYLIMGGHLEPNNNENDEDQNQEESQPKQKIKIKKPKTQEAFEKNIKELRDKYYNVSKTTYNTMVAFIFYIGFPLDPKDKEAVQKRFRDIISFRKIKPTKYRFVGKKLFFITNNFL